MSGRKEEVYYNHAKYLNLFYGCNSFVFHQQPKSEAVAICFSVMMSTFFIEKRSRGERQIFRKAAVFTSGISLVPVKIVLDFRDKSGPPLQGVV